MLFLIFLDESKAALQAALNLCDGDAASIAKINAEMLKVDKLFRRYEDRQRKMAAKMFSGGGKTC